MKYGKKISVRQIKLRERKIIVRFAINGVASFKKTSKDEPDNSSPTKEKKRNGRVNGARKVISLKAFFDLKFLEFNDEVK